MAVSARLSLNLTASQTLPSSSFISGGVNYGVNGLEQAFSASDISAVLVQELALAQGVETRLDLSDMNGGNDALGNAYATGSIVAVVVQVAAGLVAALPQHVLVRGLGGQGNEILLESDASRVSPVVWTYPSGLPLDIAPTLHFEALNDDATVLVYVLTSPAGGSVPPDRIRRVHYEARHVTLSAASETWFFSVPAGYNYVGQSYSTLVEDTALDAGTTATTFACGYSADGIAETGEWLDDLESDGTARTTTFALAPDTTPNGTGWVYLKTVTPGDSAKKVTLTLHGYLIPT